MNRTTPRTALYHNFKGIPSNNYREISRFCKENEAYFNDLDDRQYLEVLSVYIDALYEINDFGSIPYLADLLIIEIMRENVTVYRGEDNFQKTLFQKAIACYNVFALEQAEHIFQELIRLNPTNQDYIVALTNCRLRHKPPRVKLLNNLGVSLYFLTAMSIIIHIFVTQPFFSNYSILTEILCFSLFFAAIGTIFAAFILNYYLANQFTNQFVQKALSRHQQK
jgi:tetratricopeptide (TPR) repeat protein